MFAGSGAVCKVVALANARAQTRQKFPEMIEIVF